MENRIDAGIIKLDGAKLRTLRLQKGMTKQELSKAAGGKPLLAIRTISNAETGRPTRYENAVRIATALGTCVDDVKSNRDLAVTFFQGLPEGLPQEKLDLLEESFKCYVELFPDPGERDHPEDIRTWLTEAHLATVTGSPWREVYAVLHDQKQVVGMAYFSGHTKHDYWFGNYFGVLPGWARQDEGATVFLRDRIAPYLRRVLPRTKGILFEIELIPVEYLLRLGRVPKTESVAPLLQPVTTEFLKQQADNNDYEAKMFLEQHPVIDRAAAIEYLELQRAKLYRLSFYSMRHAYAFLLPLASAVPKPLPYWQPAMQISEDPNTGRLWFDPINERELILMAYPFRRDRGTEPIDKQKAIKFLFEFLYSNAYDGTSSVELPGFRDYVLSVQQRIKEHLSVCQLERLRMPTEVRRLMPRLASEGILPKQAGDVEAAI